MKSRLVQYLNSQGHRVYILTCCLRIFSSSKTLQRSLLNSFSLSVTDSSLCADMNVVTVSPSGSLHNPNIYTYHRKVAMLLENTTYSGYKHQGEDHGSSEQKPHSHNSRIHVHIVHQSVGGHDDNSQYNASDIDGSSNVLGVIQSLHFHFTRTEG